VCSVFEIFTSYGLLLGQPSLCRTPHRASYWDILYQNNGTTLRYSSFVEIMAPIFEMGFFRRVVGPSLWNAYTGWGLDFTWPFLLRYPRKRIGVIDEVCMTHAATMGGKSGEGDLYAVPVPYDTREEEARRVGEYGYYASRVEAMGLPYRNMEIWGEVRKTYFRKEDVPQVGEPNAALEDVSAVYSSGRGVVYAKDALLVAGLAMLVFSGALAKQRQRNRQRGRPGHGPRKQHHNRPPLPVSAPLSV